MYALGIDLGTTYTAAAVWRDGRAEIVSLGGRTAAIPSVVLLREDETFLTGEAANRRGLTEPNRVAREFKRRIGDTTPIMLGGTPHSAESLTSRLLRAVVEEVVKREGGPPASVCVSHPANWGPYKIDLLGQAVRMADLPTVLFATEPEAAAVHYAQEQRLGVGTTVAVYDLGGGTFDAAVLRRTATGFSILGKPEGIERLGGIDFDAAVFNHVRTALGNKLDELDEDDPAAITAVARLREECVQAKEALSADTDTTIPVLLPSVTTDVRLTRGEFESMVRPALHGSIEALQRAVRSAELTAEQLHSVLLVGGSSRMPIVGQLVSAELGRPVAVDTHPKHAVALGAAWRAGAALGGGRQGPGRGFAAGAAAGGAAGLAAGHLAGPAAGSPMGTGGAATPAAGYAGGGAGAPTGAGGSAGPTTPAGGFAGGGAGSAIGAGGGAAGSGGPTTPAAGFAGGGAGAPTGAGGGAAGGGAGPTTPAAGFAGGSPAGGPGVGSTAPDGGFAGGGPAGRAGSPMGGSSGGPTTPAGGFASGGPARGGAPMGGRGGPGDGGRRPGGHGVDQGSATRMIPVGKEAVAPPVTEKSDRRKRVLAVSSAAAVMVLLAGGAVALGVFDGDDDGKAGSAPPSSTVSKADSLLPVDEQCTEEIMSNPRWVCLTSAVVADGKITIEYLNDGASMSVDGGNHLHIYGSDGTNPPDRVMGHQVPENEQGKWYVEDRRPAVLDLNDQRYRLAIGDAKKVCARVATADHMLVKAADGSYRTGNCAPITGDRTATTEDVPDPPQDNGPNTPDTPTTTTESTTETTTDTTTEPPDDSEPAPPSDPGGESEAP